MESTLQGRLDGAQSPRNLARPRIAAGPRDPLRPKRAFPPQGARPAGLAPAAPLSPALPGRFLIRVLAWAAFFALGAAGCASVSVPGTDSSLNRSRPPETAALPAEGPGRLESVPREIRGRAEGLTALWRQRAQELGAELTWSWRRQDYNAQVVTYVVTGRWRAPGFEEHRVVTLTQHRPSAEALGPEQILGPGFLGVLPGRLAAALNLSGPGRAPSRRAAYLALVPEPEALRLYLNPEDLGRAPGPWLEVLLGWENLGPDLRPLSGL